MQVLESIIFLHMDKIAEYQGRQGSSQTPLVSKASIQEEPRHGGADGSIVFKSQYTNLMIKKTKDTGGIGNHRMYEMVFNQEAREDECFDVMRIATDMKLLKQQKVAPAHQEYNELRILSTAIKRRNQMLNEQAREQEDYLKGITTVPTDNRERRVRQKVADQRTRAEEPRAGADGEPPKAEGPSAEGERGQSPHYRHSHIQDKATEPTL